MVAQSLTLYKKLSATNLVEEPSISNYKKIYVHGNAISKI